MAPTPGAGRLIPYRFTVPPIVTWSLVTVGAWLIYASVRGLSPIEEFRAAIQGTPGPGAKPLAPYVVPEELATLGATTDGGSVSYSSRAGSITGTAKPTNLVTVGQSTIGNGTFAIELVPSAAAAFTAWQTAYGKPIRCTTAWRSYQSQADEYAKDPKRFAPPDKSWHVKGTAVDVDLAVTGATYPSAGWDKLYAAAIATGWCNPRGPYKGDHSEPWHFSYGGCG